MFSGYDLFWNVLSVADENTSGGQIEWQGTHAII